MSDEDRPITQEELRRKYSDEDAYFKKLDEERAEAARQRAKARRLRCRREGMPDDGCRLEHVQLWGIEVDRCPHCNGLWLDAHEVEELSRKLELAGKQPEKAPGILEAFRDSFFGRHLK